MCLACENRACGVLTIQTFGSLNFLFQYGTATKFSRYIDNLFGFTTLLTESKYYISVLKYVSSNDIVYFSPRALFLQARSQLMICNYMNTFRFNDGHWQVDPIFKI